MAKQSIDEQRPTRGHKKRERTRTQLIVAGVQVLAEKGDALTISDVVAQAEVSNGTFYNYFSDRDELLDALSEHSLMSLAAQAASDSAEKDPVLRFAYATSRVLVHAIDDPTWGRAILRLGDHRRSSPRELSRYLRKDLQAGFDEGRFELGPDAVTLDLIIGLIIMSIRRIVRGKAEPGHVVRVVERALLALGIPREESVRIAAHVVEDRGVSSGV